MSTISIKPGAALDDASEIDSIVAQMDEDMGLLNKTIDATIPDGIQTTWSETVKENWKGYYTADVPEAMENMKYSSANLKVAVDEAIKFDQEQ